MSIWEMSIWEKPVFSRRDFESVMPGQGKGIADTFLQAGWISPLSPAPARPLFDAAKVRACLERVLAGESPQPLYRWRIAIGQESAHLVGPHNKAACGSREREWLTAESHTRQCTRCQGAAKTLNVEK